MNHAHLTLAAAICFEIVATTALKTSDGFTRPWPSVLTIAGYGVSFYLLALTLRTMPTGVVYAIWSGAGIVLISLASWLVHGQRLDLPTVVGMGLIIAGVLVINLMSKSSVH